MDAFVRAATRRRALVWVVVVGRVPRRGAQQLCLGSASAAAACRAARGALDPLAVHVEEKEKTRRVLLALTRCCPHPPGLAANDSHPATMHARRDVALQKWLPSPQIHTADLVTMASRVC
jgi:hypothetical protein